MSAALILPKPQSVRLARLGELAAQIVVARDTCREAQDVVMAENLRRQIAAYAGYVKDKATRKALEGEERHTEVLIGELLGPRQPGRRADLTSSASDEVVTGIFGPVMPIGEFVTARLPSLDYNRNPVVLAPVRRDMLDQHYQTWIPDEELA